LHSLHLPQFAPSSLTHIDGYVTYRRDCDDGRQGGGVAILVKEGLSCHLLDLPNVHQFETLWLLYRHPRMPRELSHVLLGCVYFPPGARSGDMIEYLLASLDTVCKNTLI